MVILDCTLRDGGYYNSWDFSDELVSAYLKAVAESGIEYIELGFREFPNNTFLGPFAFTKESFLKRFKLDSCQKYGVMVNATSVINRDGAIEDNVLELFVSQKHSVLSFVRVAAYYHDIKGAIKITQVLKKLGYSVGLNLMQSTGKSDLEIKEAVSAVNLSNSVDILYYADSFGNMNDAEVRRIYLILRGLWNKPIGFHSHNNMGSAINNSLSAISVGVDWIDATVTGMGRGAGNTETELLLRSVKEIHKVKRYSAKPILKLATLYFDRMKDQCGWGVNSSYFLGALYSIHPTYVQRLLSDPHFEEEDVLNFLEYAKNYDLTKYSAIDYESFKVNSLSEGVGLSGQTLSYGVFGDEVILIGGGPSIESRIEHILEYIRLSKLTTITVNMVDSLNGSLIDYIVMSKNSRFHRDMDRHRPPKQKVIAPHSRLSVTELKYIINKAYDYQLRIGPELVLDENGCTIPYDMTSLYSICLLISKGVKKINLLGFDGYKINDIRSKEMQDSLDMIMEQFSEVEIVSLLPTTYNIQQASLYEKI